MGIDMEKIIIEIDCYQCGTKQKFVVELSGAHADYIYCNECQEGIQLFFKDETLYINRLEQE